MGGASRSGNDYLEASMACAVGISSYPLGRPMCRGHGDLSGNIESREGIEGLAHDGEVGVTPHDNSHNRLPLNFHLSLG
jgi:hypothetical protein